MNPVGGGAILVLAMFHDALAKGEFIGYPLHPASALEERGDAEVGCFASHVLTLGCSSDFWMIVECWTTVTGRDNERLADVLTKWFKDFGAKFFEVGYYLCMLRIVRIERVVDAITACSS